MAASPSAVAAPASDVAANGPERTVKFHDGVVVPALGQGSARLGQGRHPEAVEGRVTQGISLGMTLRSYRHGNNKKPFHVADAEIGDAPGANLSLRTQVLKSCYHACTIVASEGWRSSSVECWSIALESLHERLARLTWGQHDPGTQICRVRRCRKRSGRNVAWSRGTY